MLPPNNDPGFSSQNFTYGACGDNALCMKIGTRDEEGRKKEKKKNHLPCLKKERESSEIGAKGRKVEQVAQKIFPFSACVCKGDWDWGGLSPILASKYLSDDVQ